MNERDEAAGAIHDIVLDINSTEYPIRVEARKTLVDAIREDCGQTGTHIGCEHGVCGACTVLVDGEPVRSCLMFAVQAEGACIRTVEGLAKGQDFHPMQQAFMDHHALQCGFCTPGFLMLATATLERDPNIGDQELLDVLSSNLCRCTGYQNILAAVRAARAAIAEQKRADSSAVAAREDSAPARPPEGCDALPWGGGAQRQEGHIRAPARSPEGCGALPCGEGAQRQEGGS